MGKAVGQILQVVVGVALVILSSGVGASIGWSLIVGGTLGIFIAQALIGKPPSFLRNLGHDIEYSGTVEPRRIVYGEMKVSGMNVIPPWTSGASNKFLHQVRPDEGDNFKRGSINQCGEDQQIKWQSQTEYAKPNTGDRAADIK